MKNRAYSRNLLIPTALLLATLVGCSSGQEELTQWMAQEQKQAQPNVTAPKKFNPQGYLSASDMDPFSIQKLTGAVKQENRQISALLAGETSRRKEYLESFPLDTMTMVGSVIKQGRPQGLIKVDKQLYQVKVGDRLGQNYGLIKKISETGISIREIITDGSGEPAEQMSTLVLQENAR
jgi:type IV pilus assembly protein PilP